METSAQALKQAAALRAVEEVPDNSILGLGSGSTIELFIRELGRQAAAGRRRIAGVPSSLQARLLARECSLPLLDPLEADQIDLAVDGADEVDPAGNLIKGGGGAHVLEKIIAVRARRFVVVVDQSKLVTTLGERFPVPIDVITAALPYVLRRLADLGAEPAVRTGSGKMGPTISDVGHIIVDARFGPIADPAALDRTLNAIPGVVGHGLFVAMTDRVLVAETAPAGPVVRVIDFSKK